MLLLSISMLNKLHYFNQSFFYILNYASLIVFIFVIILVPSSIQAIQNKTATEGDSVTLLCNASGIPPPMVSWITPGGQRINQSELVLTHINRSEAGEYRCEASNECGNASETATIDVQCKFGQICTCI